MARKGKLNELADLAAMQKQQEEVLSMIKGIVTAISEVQPIRIKVEGAEKTKDIVEGAKRVQEATSGIVDKTNLAVTAFGELIDMTKKANTSYNSLGKSLEENIRQQTQYKQRLDEIKDSLKKLDDLNKIGGSAAKQVAAQVAELKKEQYELANANSEVTRTIKSQIKESQAAAGSYDEMNARLGQLRNAYRQLNDEQRNGEIGQSLLAQIEPLDDKLKAIDASIGNFQRNVGNYGGAFTGAFRTLQVELQKVQDSINSGGFEGDALQALQRQEALLTEITAGLGKQFTSTREEARAFQEAAAKIGITLGQQSEAFQSFRKEVGEGVDAIQDVKDSIKLAASDTGALDNLIKSAQGLAGAYGVAAGAIDLFGGSSEAAAEATRKLAAIMTILQGLQGIQNELTRKDSILRKAANFLIGKQTQLTYAQTAALQTQATATNITTKATKGLGIALKAIGIGVLLALIPMISKAADLFDGVTRAQKKNLEVAEKNVTAEEERLEELKLSENSLKLQGKSEEQILRLKVDQVNKTIDAKKRQLELNKATLQGQVDAAKRNKEILSGLINFITAPLNAILFTIEKVSGFFGKKLNLPSVGEALSGLVFDPDKVKKDSEATISEIDRAIKELESERDGYRLSLRAKSKEDLEQAKKNAEAERKALFDIEKQKIQDKILAAEQYAQDENNSFRSRLEAEKAYYNFKKELLDLQLKYELEQAEKRGKEEKKTIDQINTDKLLIQTKYNSDILGLNAESEKRHNDLVLQNANKRKEILTQELDEEERDRQSALELSLQKVQNIYAKENLALDRKFLAGLIKERKYNIEKAKLQDKFLEESLKRQIYFAKKEIQIAEDKAAATGNQEDIDRVALLKTKLAGLEIDLQKSVTQSAISNNKAIKESDEQLWSERIKKLQAYKQIAENVFAIINELGSIGPEREIAAIQEQITLLEAKAAKEIQLAEQSSATEQEKANKIAIIQARTEAQRVQLEQKRRKAELEKAKFDKASNIASIISGTALAVVNTLADKTIPTLIRIPLAVTVGALGAAQLIKAIATPIPKYAEGTDDHKGGFAIVGDGGRKELVKEPTGKTWVTDDKPQLVDLPKGSQVFPDAEKALAYMTIGAHNQTLSATAPKKQNDNYQFQNMTRVMRHGFYTVNKTIKEKQENHFLIESPLKRWRSSGDNIEQFLGR